MSDFGLSDLGFKRKRLDAILADLNAEMKSVLGENLNLSPQSPDGQINGIVSETYANLWELSEQVYNAFNPSAAKGVSLSNLVQLNGITRLPATKSIVTLLIQGTPGTIIPTASRVSSEDSTFTFITDFTAVIGTLGSIEVQASCSVTGPIQATPNTLTNIETPVSGWSSVTNPLSSSVGTDEETDVELRARRARSVARTSQAVVDSIFASVSDVPGVTRAVVLENDTEFTAPNGLPPHSFSAIVLGGQSEDIGLAIWRVKPAGIQAFGNQTVIISDSQGLPHNISFSRADLIDIYIEITLNTFSNFPSDGEEMIKQAIVDYANGELVEGAGFSLGDDVIYSRLYTPINRIQGHEVLSLTIGTSPSPTGVINIPIGIGEISNFTTDNISVIIV